MRLEDAHAKIQPIVGVPFSDLPSIDYTRDLRTNKGLVGQTLERIIGLGNSSRALDFDDGELKTNMSTACGDPRETMFITMVSSSIDEILMDKPFHETMLARKTRNILYVPVCKEGEPADWFFLPPLHVDMTCSDWAEVAEGIRLDYAEICRQVKRHIESSPNGSIHTSSGQYIQIRSKDSKPYHPIYSKQLERRVSNKNHAYYFKKEFMRRIQASSRQYPYRRPSRLGR